MTRSFADCIRFGVAQPLHGSSSASNLAPDEAEAFSLSVECENTVNLIDLEVEVITSLSPQPYIFYPKEIIVAHCPATDVGEPGTVRVLDRTTALRYLLSGGPLDLWPGTKYANCRNSSFLLVRAAASLAMGDLQNNFDLLLRVFANSSALGPVLASFAELSQRCALPESIVQYLGSTVRNPRTLRRLMVSDTESYGAIIARALAQLQKQ